MTPSPQKKIQDHEIAESFETRALKRWDKNIKTEILEAFKIFDDNYKREQVDAAIELKKEITTHLIEILDKGLVDPK